MQIFKNVVFGLARSYFVQRKAVILLLFITLLSLANNASAQPGYVLEMLREPEVSFSLEKAVNSKDFARVSELSMNFGRTQAAYWFRLSMDTTSGNGGMLLKIGYSLIDSIDFYYQSTSERWELAETGSSRPYLDRIVPHRHFLFPVQPGNTYFLRIESSNPMKLPFEVVYNVNFFQKEMTTQILYGIFIGIILLACILNLVFYFFLKEPYFLLYVLYMFFTLLFNLFLSGHIFSLVWLSYGEWQNLAFLQNFNLIFVLALLFVLKFLDLKNLSPANYLVFKIAFGVHLAISAMIFLGDYALLNALLELDALLFLLWVLYLGVLSWKSGNRPARFFLVAYFIYLLMVLPIILMSFALVTESFLTRHGTELAVLLEAIFLAFALADRYQYERQHITAEKDLAQQRAVRIQQDAHARLEKEVSQRTYELRKTNEELFQKNKEILLQKYDIDQKNKALEKVNRNKDKFFSILAHDVRAPLNSLITFTSLLENDQNLLSEEESLLLRKGLNQQVKNLHNMLDNVLDWSRSQLGGIRLSLKEANPMKHIESVVNLLAPTAAQKGVKLYSLVIHSPEVMADEQALETILRNLIGNAIKFTPEGGTVTVSTSELGGMLVFAITDTGTGLSEDLQKSLFLTKEKKPIPGTAGEKGTGLGLSICQEFVQALSGEIWVESQQGQGSVFYFSLPMICSSKEIKPEKAKAI